MHALLRYFGITHLPVGPMRQVAGTYTDLACEVDRLLPDGPEKTVALRKLLESKDAAVRSAMDAAYDGQPEAVWGEPQ